MPHYARPKPPAPRSRLSIAISRIYLLICMAISVYLTWSSITAYNQDGPTSSIAILMAISVPIIAIILAYSCRGDYSFFGICMLLLGIFIHIGMRCMIFASVRELEHYRFVEFGSPWSYAFVFVFIITIPVTMILGIKLSRPIKDIISIL